MLDLFEFEVKVRRPLESCECCTLAPLLLVVLGVVELAVLDLLNGVWIEPSYALSVFPEAELELLLGWVLVHPKSVLLPVEPPSFILSAIGPKVETIAILFVRPVLTFIRDSI